jgi:hypothetical protein
MTYTYSSDNSTLTVDSPIVMGYDDPVLNAGIARCRDYNGQNPVNKIRFWEVSPGEYRFKVDLKDGRTWKQEVYFSSPNDADPDIENNTNGKWKFTEIFIHNNLRSILIRARVEHGITDWNWQPL